jgi:hypothetical protein
MSGLCNQCHAFLKDYETVTEIFTDNDSEVKCFDDSISEIGDCVVGGMK